MSITNDGRIDAHAMDSCSSLDIACEQHGISVCERIYVCMRE